MIRVVPLQLRASGASSSFSVTCLASHSRRAYFGSTPAALAYRPVTQADKPVQHVISRTRTWRGIMQVAPASPGLDRKTTFYNIFFFLPFQVVCGLLLTTGAYYFVAGHDQFMFEVCGYESEMQYEGAVNPRSGTLTPGVLATMDKAQTSPLRDLEKPLHPAPSFTNQTLSGGRS